MSCLDANYRGNLDAILLTSANMAIVYRNGCRYIITYTEDLSHTMCLVFNLRTARVDVKRRSENRALDITLITWKQ